jgi:hypothetical protein
MQSLQRFGKTEMKAVERACAAAEELVGDFYVLAPRERERMNYEVRTLEELAPEEICDKAFAQVLCYDCTRCVGSSIIDRRELYRICLQDHRILCAAGRLASDRPALEPFLLYILTHELVHVVRFSQQMQKPDLAPELRPQEELSVEQTTHRILTPVADQHLKRVMAEFAGRQA